MKDPRTSGAGWFSAEDPNTITMAELKRRMHNAAMAKRKSGTQVVYEYPTFGDAIRDGWSGCHWTPTSETATIVCLETGQRLTGYRQPK